MTPDAAKTDYLKGISIVKHFLDDFKFLSEEKYEKIDLNFYKDNFEKLLFYISKSFLSENFDYLSHNLDDEVLRGAFNENVRLNSFLDEHSPVAIYLSKRQYCRLPKRLSDDSTLGYRVAIRNSLCHYKYKIIDDKIVFEKVNFNEDAEISIASLSLLVGLTLTSYGQSRKKGAYDYWPLIDPSGDNSSLILIKNIDDNEVSPSNFISWSQHLLAKRQDIDTSLTPRRLAKFIKGYAPNFGRYYIKIIDFDKSILQKAHLGKVSNYKELNLYMCAHDEIKCYGIAYNMLECILFDLYSRKTDSLLKKYSELYPILENTVFISYISLIFDDLFTKDFNGTIDSDLFIEKSEIDNKDIPRKIRDSLMHSRYHFENIFDSSNKIVIELWDEDKGKINFNCKITKENAMLLAKDFLSQLEK